MSIFKNFIEKIWEDEFKISLFILAVAFLLINLPTILSGRYFEKDFLESMLSNANSMILDILVILCLTTFLIKKSEKRREIQRLKDEIDDFRGWQSEEASHRIRGIIFRLNKLGVTELKLYGCYLKKADLNNTDLCNANLIGTNLCEANLFGTNLFCANLEFANLNSANLSMSNLSGARLWNTNFCNAELNGACLDGADGRGVNFEKAELTDAWLRGTYLHEANLIGVNFSGAILNGAYLCNALLAQASFNGADITRVNFNKADLRSTTSIKGAKGLAFADFTDAILDDDIRQFLSKINNTVKPIDDRN